MFKKYKVTIIFKSGTIANFYCNDYRFNKETGNYEYQELSVEELKIEKQDVSAVAIEKRKRFIFF